ncbi:MAG: ergothioneine biosynthesis protein EgtB [Xenococcaceae cyanobacterium]
MQIQASPSPVNTNNSLLNSYRQVRNFSEKLCQPLATEDYIIQSMPDVSPPKWHLAHTTWFFETFLLVPHLKSYQVFHPKFGYLFNSYYEAVGDRYPRPQRGLLSRPTVEEVYQYRHYVDRAMEELFQEISGDCEIESLIILGLNHEQQHQELLLTDLKYNFAINPLRPAYCRDAIYRTARQGKSEETSDLTCLVSTSPKNSARQKNWLDCPGGLYEIGFAGSQFAFDNESPRHKIYLQDYRLASQLVTNAEYLEFIEAGGYSKPEYWLAEGWATIQTENWQAPLYWEKIDGEWWTMTLAGMRVIDENEPVCHVSLYEADAYASFRGKRLPTEAEWEVVASQQAIAGNFVESGRLHPVAATEVNSHQMFGDFWEWTQSAYLPYPGFQSATGAVGEYNGKFMCNQMVLRGGSCVTSTSHMRSTYRNFFPASARWQFSGIRLAETV